MVNHNLTSLCRICLQEGASIPIFETVKKETSVNSKLRECFKEKIEDVEGYPRNICSTCNKTLETVCNFIRKFKETHKILEGGPVRLKQENNEVGSDFETDELAEIPIEIQAIKPEPEIFLEIEEETDHYIDLLQPLQGVAQKEIKRESFKTQKVSHKVCKNKYKNRTDKVATSILEGEFSWTGETWCLKSTQLKIPKTKQVKSRRRDTRLKLPRKTLVKQPKLCDVCGDTFKTQYKLNLHRKKIHFNNPMQCTQCSRICSSENNLLRHMKRKHAQKEFICSTCGSGFAFKGELTNHINKVHSKRPKRIYACKFCDKTYNTQKSVVIHERSFHTGERPAECTICFKGFFHEAYLKEHMRLHTGEAPFKCPICGRGYAQRGNMKSHLRIHRISEIDAVTLSKIKPNYLKLLKN